MRCRSTQSRRNNPYNSLRDHMKAMRLLCLATLALAACSKPVAPEKPAEAAAPAKPPFLTVNGKAISNELYEDYAQSMTNGKAASELSPDDREQLREEL